MIRILTFSLLWLFMLQTPAQAPHSCAIHMPSDADYENPLNDTYLSAYDVKHYHLSLEVSNTSTIIDGSLQVIAEATRQLDTLVLELHGRLVVSAV